MTVRRERTKRAPCLDSAASAQVVPNR
jgi:hypothetical protein